ncbi:hypothetical protein BJY04DRAFT_41883 [Aspergillus karnatakaensis]|uniref:uncharacterized protein n=1 Tax=Aspergillus karnatakaensis TaxID=1810916 RepID=UPI003CCE4747
MSKTITVVGATGIQGGSVIRALLADQTSPYAIRAITRDPNSPAAQALSNHGVDVVKADLHHLSSLIDAFQGSHAIFAVTNFFENLPTQGVEGAMRIETDLGINLAKAAAATHTLEHYIWSTLPNSRMNSSGNAVVPYYESKNRVDDYIRSLPELHRRTTFVWFGWYTGNLAVPIYRPVKIPSLDGEDRSVILLNVEPETKFPILGDENVNPGLFVKAILEQPEKSLPGRCVSGTIAQTAFADVVGVLSKVKGVDVRPLQVRREDYAALWPGWGQLLELSHYYLSVAEERAFEGADESVVTAEDLRVEGLVSLEEALKGLDLPV